MVKYRVWWISKPPREGFYYEVKNLEEAKKVVDVLAKYDLYLGDLIDCNVCGVQELGTDGEWNDCECPECYEDILNCRCNEEDK